MDHPFSRQFHPLSTDQSKLVASDLFLNGPPVAQSAAKTALCKVAGKVWVRGTEICVKKRELPFDFFGCWVSQVAHGGSARLSLCPDREEVCELLTQRKPCLRNHYQQCNDTHSNDFLVFPVGNSVPLFPLLECVQNSIFCYIFVIVDRVNAKTNFLGQATSQNSQYVMRPGHILRSFGSPFDARLVQPPLQTFTKTFQLAKKGRVNKAFLSCKLNGMSMLRIQIAVRSCKKKKKKKKNQVR